MTETAQINTKINTKMFRRILSWIELNPETFEMSDWFQNFTVDAVEEYDGETHEWFVPEDVPMTLTLDLDVFDSEDKLVSEPNVCGTTFCISGFALLFDGWTFKRDQMHPEKEGEEFKTWTVNGARILGLAEWDARRLFSESNNVALAVVRQLADGAQSIDWEVAYDDPCDCGCNDEECDNY